MDGVTTARGRIRLDSDAASNTWRGGGELASETSSGTGTCPSMALSGSGVYDWVIRSATAGPDLAADAFVVHMDSGPITENPDTFVVDACGSTIDGVMNTWENLFFDMVRDDRPGAPISAGRASPIRARAA